MLSFRLLILKGVDFLLPSIWRSTLSSTSLPSMLVCFSAPQQLKNYLTISLNWLLVAILISFSKSWSQMVALKEKQCLQMWLERGKNESPQWFWMWFSLKETAIKHHTSQWIIRKNMRKNSHETIKLKHDRPNTGSSTNTDSFPLFSWSGSHVDPHVSQFYKYI